MTDLDGICFIAHNGSYIEIDGAEFVKKLNDYKVEFKYTAKADLESGIGKISLMSLDDIETFVSGKDILDLNSTTCNKGTAVTQLQEKLGISPDETIVFGDAENDIPMFATSTHRYAMMNAPQSVKQHARFAAPGNDELGVVSVLRERGNIEFVHRLEEYLDEADITTNGLQLSMIIFVFTQI